MLNLDFGSYSWRLCTRSKAMSMLMNEAVNRMKYITDVSEEKLKIS